MFSLTWVVFVTAALEKRPGDGKRWNDEAVKTAALTETVQF